MVVPHLRCRSQCFEFMRVEVHVQPDREHAKRDDAGVDVAAHFFSLSRGFLRSASAVCRRFSRLAPRALCCLAAAVKTWCVVAFDPDSSSRSHQTRVRGMYICAAACCVALRRRKALSFPSQFLLVCHRTLASRFRFFGSPYSRQPPPCRQKQAGGSTIAIKLPRY